MEKFRYVILGGGTAAGYAARQLVNEGIDKNQLCLVSEETILPMNRIQLSKKYLQGKAGVDHLLINSEKFYADNEVQVITGTRVTSVDFNAKTLLLDGDMAVGYEKLLIATGSKVKHPGLKGLDLNNIFSLRSKEDADRIQSAAGGANKAVVMGAGFIGTEVAASLKQIGIDVALVFPEQHLLPFFKCEELGIFFNQFMEKQGIKVVKGAAVKEFKGERDVESVVLDNGEEFKADMVVYGVGVSPRTELFEDTALALDDGIVVDEYGQTNIDDVYAAGDVARYPDHLFHLNRRDEHWKHAFAHGSHVAKVMYGYREPFDYLPFIFSHLFDFSYEYFGERAGAGQYVIHGDLNDDDFGVFWLKDNRMVAAFLTSNRPRVEREKVQKWILENTSLNPDVLANSDVPFKEAAV